MTSTGTLSELDSQELFGGNSPPYLVLLGSFPVYHLPIKEEQF
jgi:hypothetical protein